MAGLSVTAFQGFWRGREDTAGYLVATDRSRALRTLIEDVPLSARILEIGCGAGRNLAYLFDEGYERVDGLDINRSAEGVLRARYPQLAERPVHVGAAEDILPLVDGPYDLIFSMAALGHIHPDVIAKVCDEIARLTSDVLVIETPRCDVKEFAAHDYEALFGSRGYALTSHIPMTTFSYLAGDGLASYVAFRFKR